MQSSERVAVIGLAVWCAAVGPVRAQQRESLDLTGPPGVQSDRSVAPGAIVVHIGPLAPGNRYTVKTDVREFEVDPLQLPSGFPIPLSTIRSTELSARFRSRSRSCEPLLKAINELKSETDEELVDVRVRKLRETLADHGRKCDDLKGQAELVLKHTHREEPLMLLAGQRASMTVTRPDGDGVAKTWEITLRAPSRGRWFTSFAFAFSEDQNERYFTSPSDGGFVILKKEDNLRLAVTPAVFFSWMPRRGLTRDLSLGVFGGLGWQTDRPAVLLGGGLTYNQNLSLVVGAMGRSVTVLNGKYSYEPENPTVIGSDLSEDQLVEDTFRASFFVAVSFRFGSNPFGTGGATTPAGNGDGEGGTANQD